MTDPKKRTFTERIEVAGADLARTLQDLVDQGNARRVVIRNKEGRVLVEIPLTAGAVIGGAVALAAPVLAAVGALAALVTEVTLDIERDEDDDKRLEPGPEGQGKKDL